MKYSLRSLMIVLVLAPPLLALGWAKAKVLVESFQPKVIPCGHPVNMVSWKEATVEVARLRPLGGGFQSVPASKAKDENPPNP